MLRWVIVAIFVVVSTGVAAPVPAFVEAKVLVAGLSDPSGQIRDRSAMALRDRPDALPWLRRAARSSDQDTARRATQLLAPSGKKHQQLARQALHSCIRESRADLFVEWHQFWQPDSTEELWPAITKLAKAGSDVMAARFPANALNPIEEAIGVMALADQQDQRVLDGSFQTLNSNGPWRIRTNYLTTGSQAVMVASVAGALEKSWFRGGYYFALGEVRTDMIDSSIVVSDRGLSGRVHRNESNTGPRLLGGSFIVCRGDIFAQQSTVVKVVVLAGGDIDLSKSTELKDSLIRASGEIHLPKNYKPTNCTIEAHAKDATAPYRFFELTDVGLSLADDEEGLVVAGVKSETPFGNCGLAKGDVILAIDDNPAGHSEEFRKLVRRALVRQGDCLLTVVRAGKTLDLPVFFPLPK